MLLLHVCLGRQFFNIRYMNHILGSDLFGAGLLAIVRATRDPTKFQPVSQGFEEIAYCEETGEIWDMGDDEATVIQKYPSILV